MEVLKDMFPKLSDDQIQIALADCGGDLDAAIDYCLNMEAISNLPQSSQQHHQQPSTNIPKPKESEKDKESNNDSDNKQLSQMEMDEMLARELASSFSNYSPPRHRRQPLPDTSSVNLGEVDAGVMAELLGGVARSMLPLLRDQLKSLQIPPVNQQLEAGKLGNMIITIDEIKMSETSVPEEGIEIKSEGSEVLIKVKDVSASLQQFKWGYEKLSFPKVKDTGNADASISETTIEIKLKIGADEFGNASMAVTHCKVDIGKLELKISGSFASFLYNTLMGVFKKTIKATLETNFEEMIISSVGEGSTNLFDS